MHSYLYSRLVILLLLSYVTGDAQIPFDTVISFGDSNTDTDNVYQLTNRTWPIVPPYHQGRFSNGPVWIERLGVADVDNYAHGGATTDNNFIRGYTASDTILVPGVRQQISIYLNKTKGIAKNFTRRLYVIWVGGNDYYFNQTISPMQVTTSILNAVKDLLNIGVKHLLLVNQAPVQNMPFVRTEERIIYYRERTIYHNNNLSIGKQNLDYNHAEVKLYLFDIYSFLLGIANNYSQYSFNTRAACWNVSNRQVIDRCSNPELYIYIDQYHFTAIVHELIGNEVRKFLASLSIMTKASFSINLIIFVVLMLL